MLVKPSSKSFSSLLAKPSPKSYLLISSSSKSPSSWMKPPSLRFLTPLPKPSSSSASPLQSQFSPQPPSSVVPTRCSDPPGGFLVLTTTALVFQAHIFTLAKCLWLNLGPPNLQRHPGSTSPLLYLGLLWSRLHLALAWLLPPSVPPWTFILS